MIDSYFRKLTVLSLEQALSMPYCTFRMALRGMRVIRVEPQRGDPNRRVGKPIDRDGLLCRYFVPANGNKESVTLNLKSEKGRRILHELLEALEADIFCTNQLPANYEPLGIDPDTLGALRPGLIWTGISGFGPERSEAAYDPMVQATTGVMEITGEPDRDPMTFGAPIVDLEAANQAYTRVIEALLERKLTGEGSRIDVAMAECSLSLLVNKIPFAGLGERVSRNGNTHPFFGPVSSYPVRDGFVMIAIGNNRQWQQMVSIPGFESLDRPERAENAGRMAGIDELNTEIRAITADRESGDLVEAFRSRNIPIAKVSTVKDLFDDPYVSARLMRVRDPVGGFEAELAPPPTPPSEAAWSDPESRTLRDFPPRLGEQNQALLGDLLGYDLEQLRDEGVA